MRTSFRLLALAGCIVAGLAASALALGLDDLVRMRDAGMGDAVLIKAVETQGVDFEATPENLLKLKEKKFSDEVLVAVLAAAAKKRPAATPAPVEPKPEPGPPPKPEPPPAETGLRPPPGRNPFLNRDKKCPQCGNLGILACPQHKPGDFVISILTKELPQCCGGVGWVECPTCHDDLTRQGIEELRRALAARVQEWKVADKAAGQVLFHGETRHFTLHSDLNPQEVAKIGAACEDLLVKLREVFKSDVFDFTRPGDTNIVAVSTVDRMTTLVDWIGERTKAGAETKIRMVKTSGMTLYGSQGWVLNIRERSPDGLNGIVHGYGHVLVNHVYGFKGRLPAWTNEGFGSFCEALECGKPRSWCISYDPREVNPGAQWKETVRAAVLAGKAATLEKLFGKSLGEMSALDYQQSWSVTSALIYGGPDKYLLFLQAVKDRQDQTEALEKAFGAKIDQIEKAWKEYAARP